MTQINNPKVAFAYLRPACVLLTREPTVANVETLGGQLRELDEATLQQLQEYVLFPLRFVLKLPARSPQREHLVQSVVEAITHVLETTCVQSWETLRELLSELCLCLSSPTEPGRPTAGASEELKGAVLSCLSALLHAAYGDTLLQLYQPAMRPGLGAAVSLLLALGEQERSRAVQLGALGVLQTLGGQCDCDRGEAVHVTLGEGERQVMGHAMASFLPGITMALGRVVAGDPRHGHAVTVGAIKVWYRTVGLVMEDAQLRDLDPREAGPAGQGLVGQLVVLRSPDWVKGTAGRLGLLLKRLISCTAAHRHWRVRLELVELADHLLARCSRSLGGDCMGPLLEALVGAVNDEEPRVRQRCETALRDASERGCGGVHGDGLHDDAGGTSPSQTFAEVLLENLHSLATSLPRLLRAADDHKKLLVLNVFLGYLKLLGPLVSMALNSAAHLNRISKALMQVLELDVTDVRIVEERNSTAVMETASGSVSEDHPAGHAQRKHFLYFRDEKIFSVLMEICRTLGYHGDTYLLVDHFLDLYRESSAYRKQAAMVLNEVVMGATGVGVTTWGQGSGGGCGLHAPAGGDADRRSAVVAVLEEYTSERNWNLATVSQQPEEPQDQELLGPSRVLSMSPGDFSSSSYNLLQVVSSSSSSISSSSSSSSLVRQLNSNIWQLCIQLEGVACGARTLGRDFRPLLMTSLYAVLEKAGDEALLVSEVALACTRRIAEACGYASPRQLIADNSDYLLNDVSLNLLRLQQNPQAPRVLAVILAHSDASLLPLVADMVQDVLLALDLSYDHTAALFGSVLHSLMRALVRWFAPNPDPPGGPGSGREQRSGPDPESMTALDVRQFLLDYRRQKELAEGIGAEEEDAEEEGEEPVAPPPEEEEERPFVKKELPAHIVITKEVMKRCTHLLSDPSLRIRLKVLDILELCVRVLHEEVDELLPMVHCCWPALICRMTDDHPLAVLRGFRVLCTMGEACGDFLRSRVSKEVLPRLGCSLARQAPVSARAGPVYAHTLAYKLQLAVLRGLGPLCLRLQLGEADLESVCEACLPYLSCRQPISLQEACLSVFRALIQVDPDAFWLVLSQLHAPILYAPPHPDLQTLQLGGAGPTRDQYAHNLDRLLGDAFGAPGSQTPGSLR